MATRLNHCHLSTIASVVQASQDRRPQSCRLAKCHRLTAPRRHLQQPQLRLLPWSCSAQAQASQQLSLRLSKLHLQATRCRHHLVQATLSSFPHQPRSPPSSRLPQLQLPHPVLAYHQGAQSPPDLLLARHQTAQQVMVLPLVSRLPVQAALVLHLHRATLSSSLEAHLAA